VITGGTYCIKTHCLGDLGAMFKKEAATKDKDDELPIEDCTGKVYGKLPKIEELDRYSADGGIHFRQAASARAGGGVRAA
jgi:hypothetical protein